MRLIIILGFFAGALFIIYGLHIDKINELKKRVKVEYRFIPRSYYDEQLFSNQFTSKFENIFDYEQPIANMHNNQEQQTITKQ